MADTESDMEKINSFYQSTVCHVCKEFTPSLKRCAGCKLYAYCSKQHQQYHWKSHKELCRMVKSLLTKNGKNRKHIFDIEGIHGKTHEDWRQMKVDLKFLWENLLNRSLTDGENQVWMFPRVCEICRFSQQDSLFDCTRCYSVSYCSNAHQTMHSKIHQSYCQSLKLCFDINCQLFHNEDCAAVPTLKISANLTKLPENMGTFIRECTVNVNASIFAQTMAGDMLSPVLTIINALEQTSSITSRHFRKQSFVLHLIGAALYEQSFHWEWFIECLLLWMTNVQQVTVILVGPDLVHGEQVNNGDCVAGKKCKLLFERCLYHDYVKSKTFIAPDLMVAFNCGLHEYQEESAQSDSDDSWAKSVPSMLLQSNVPLLLTAYTHAEALLDFQRLTAMNSGAERNFNAPIRCERNEFRGFRPLRDWSTCDKPVFYQNNYVTVIKIK